MKNNEFDIQSAKASMLAIDACYYAYVNSRISSKPLSPILCFMEGSSLSANVYQMISKKVMKALARELYQKFLNNRRGFYDNFHLQKKVSDQIDIFWKKYSEKEKEITQLEEMAGFFEKFANLFNEWWTFSVFGEDKGQTVFEDFLPRFARRHKLPVGEAQQKIFLLTHPKGKAIFNQEREDFLNICLNYREKKKLKRLIEAYIRKYFWIRTDFCRKVEVTSKLILSEAKKEINEKTRSEIKAELKKMVGADKSIKKQKIKLSKTIKLFDEDKKYFEFTSFLIGWQDYRKAMMMKTFYYLFSIVEDVSKIAKISYEKLAFCFLSEFINFLKTGNFPPIHKGQILVFYKRENSPLILKDKNIIETIKKILKDKKDKVRRIIGTTASTGKIKKIKGKVKIILDPKRQTFNEGEILVTSMTRVEFIPIIKKALAIITDEGGIACHAAIVSRELGIPCIIGTKIATKILKDNNLVEIDIKNGTVKIIKVK